jgi:phosphatidate cytidylyltransferase
VELRLMNSSLLRRTLAGLVFVMLVTGAAYLGRVAFLMLALFFVWRGLAEFYGLARAWGASPLPIPGTILGLAAVTFAYLWGASGLALAAAVTTALCAAFSVLYRTGAGLAGAAATWGGVLYVAFLGSHMVTLREGPGGAGLSYSLGFTAVMMAFASTWCCDTAAYLIGGAVGSHKLVPSVSPNKSWEGAAAGLLGAVAGLAVVKAALGAPSGWVELIPLGLGLGALAQVGDLVESSFKRRAAVKDSSDIIPGHGGVLDRFDGFLFAAPALYYYLAAVGFRSLG